MFARLGMVCAAGMLWAGVAVADDPPLSCRDVNETTGAAHLDAFNLGTLSFPVQQAFRAADAERAGNGERTFLDEWNNDRLIGEVVEVFLSCKRHPTDSVDQRARAVFQEYVVLHSQ